MPMLRRSSTGRDWSSWPVLLLLLTVLVPTGGVVWMMRAAMENERLAMRQRLADAYQAQLDAAKIRVSQRWTDELQRTAQVTGGLSPSADFARCIAVGFADSVMVLDNHRQVAYPASARAASFVPDPAWSEAQRAEFVDRDPVEAAKAYAAIAAAAGDSQQAARAMQAQARCLLQTGDRTAAIDVLRKLSVLTEAVDPAGRSLAADAQLRLLELLESNSPEWTTAANSLRARLSTYGSPPTPADQRRFLMHRLTELTPGAPAFPTLAAEDLAAEVLDALADANPAAKRAAIAPHADPGQLDPAGLPNVWRTEIADGRLIALFRTATLQSFIQTVLADQSLPAGVTVATRVPSAITRSSDDFLTASVGDNFPGWRLALNVDNSQLTNSSIGGRRAFLAWIAAAIIAITLAFAWLAIETLRRQMRIARLKNDLVATVSHELKTPLSSIRLLVDSLLDEGDESTSLPALANGKTRDYLELISHENARLTRLIDNFLTFSRLDRGKQQFNLQSIDAAEVVRRAAAVANRFDGEDAKLHIEIEGPLPIQGDVDALVAAVVNLLDNAWKYTGATKQVAITAQRRDNRAEISVADNGVGLSPRAARRVFDRFYQVDQQLSRAQGGCGLGLSIVRSIVEAHGGHTSVESEPGQGSKFTLSIPLS